jgi:hypothetical protein
MFAVLMSVGLFACGGGGSGGSDDGNTAATSALMIDWTTAQNHTDTRTLDLSGRFDYNDYKFIGYAGQTYTITLTNFTDDLDLYLMLDQGDFHVSVDASVTAGLAPEKIEFACNQDGVYIISVSGHNESTAKSSNYTLTLSSTNVGSGVGIATGRWSGAVTTRWSDENSNDNFVLELTQNGANVTGTLTVGSESPINVTGTVSGDGLTFSGVLSCAGNRTVQFSGIISDNTLTITSASGTDCNGATLLGATGTLTLQQASSSLTVAGTWNTRSKYSTCPTSANAYGTVQFASSGSTLTGFSYSGQNWHHDCTVTPGLVFSGSFSGYNLTDPLTDAEIKTMCEVMGGDPDYTVSVSNGSSAGFTCSFYDNFDGSTEVVNVYK